MRTPCFRLFASPPALLLASLLALASFVSPTSATEVLTGVIGPRTINADVLIPANKSCTLNGTIIKGRLAMDSSARLKARNAIIRGDLISLSGGRVDLQQNTRILGNVGLRSPRTVSLRTGSFVKGSLEITSGKALRRSSSLVVSDSVINQNLTIVLSAGAIRITDSTIKKDVNVLENTGASFSIEKNRVRGSLVFIANKGNGRISRNRVTKDLRYSKNTPTPVVRNNTVLGSIITE